MDTRNEITEIRERFTDGNGQAPEPRTPRPWRRALATLAVVFVAAVTGGVLFVGCGARDDGGTQAAESHTTSGGTTAGQTQVASATPAAPQGGLTPSDVAVMEGLPPDLSVSVEDTLVTPGDVVEFRAQGTPDVASVALADGRDEPTPMVRDAGKDTWRVQYRVPLHPRQERFGVSLTAKTEANHWRRVWVFLHVAGADSTDADNPDEMGDPD